MCGKQIEYAGKRIYLFSEDILANDTCTIAPPNLSSRIVKIWVTIISLYGTTNELYVNVILEYTCILHIFNFTLVYM